ncbi:MAG: BamA/TamA family outer membrane protein [Fibrobacteria bacterium]|nr:BamA/TamA family outer membrane protein [Fibrobacteria bacterium]
MAMQEFIDSLQSGENRNDTNIFYEYIAHPVLALVTWPMEKFVVPVIETALYPAKPPLRYMLNEQVLERAIDLISFGEKNQIMLYPTLVITTGTGSLVGFTARHKKLFGRNTERLVVSFSFFVNGNWKMRYRFSAKKIGGSKLNANIKILQDNVKNKKIPPPQTGTMKYHSDTSWGISSEFNHPLFEEVDVVSGFHYRHRKFDAPPKGLASITCGDDGPFFASDNCVDDRALNTTFQDYSWSLGVDRNTVNNENIPTSGNHVNFWWMYHWVTDNRDFHEWELTLKKYFFLGVERYEITPTEQREMGDLNFSKIKKTLKYHNLKKQIFNRKVIAAQLRVAQAYEVYEGRAPVYALHNLSNDTPMRGYSSSPFRDWTKVALCLEYRFPIIRLVEGTIFDEQGIVGENFNTFELDQLKNSWGFGIRIARRDIFLCRGQLGFPGWGPPVINITVDTVF